MDPKAGWNFNNEPSYPNAPFYAANGAPTSSLPAGDYNFLPPAGGYNSLPAGDCNFLPPAYDSLPPPYSPLIGFSQQPSEQYPTYPMPCYAPQPSEQPIPPPRMNRGIIHTETNAGPVGYINGNYQPMNMYPSLPVQSKVEQMSTDNSNIAPLPPSASRMWPTTTNEVSVQIAFVQHNGYVVSPKQALPLIAYKCQLSLASSPTSSAYRAGRALDATLLLQAGRMWRFGMNIGRSFVLKGHHEELVFYDDSTAPTRHVIVLLPLFLGASERQRLHVLLKGSARISSEPAGVIEKVETGVETAYDTVTDGLNAALKKGNTNIYNKTKSIRKGAGQLVRLGGSLISKGAHLVSDSVTSHDKETKTSSKEMSDQHLELMRALSDYRKCREAKTISEVDCEL